MKLFYFNIEFWKRRRALQKLVDEALSSIKTLSGTQIRRVVFYDSSKRNLRRVLKYANTRANGIEVITADTSEFRGKEGVDYCVDVNRTLEYLT